MTACVRCSATLPGCANFCPVCGASRDVDSLAATVATPRESSPPASPSAPTSRKHDSSGVYGRFVPGTLIGERYRIVALLGRGGMGEVYRADDLTLDQSVALKFLPEAVERDPQRLELLLGEVRNARQVAHANVCRVYDIDDAEGHPFISMEFVDGEDLASLLRRIGHLPRDKAIEIGRQICAGLAAAHEQGLVHRDLKPANVMVDGRGRARITDFGLAVPGGSSGSPAVGTPAYMAPEQRAGGAATIRSDIYALGLILYELFTGRPAYRFQTLAELDRLQTSGPPESPSALVDGVDPASERAIMRCLARDPNERTASALQVAAALPGGDPLAAALAAGEIPTAEMVAEAKTAEAMSPPLALGLAALCVALFVGAGLLTGRESLRAYVPLDRPPTAMVDRAREMISRLGYTGPLHQRPADRAFGYVDDQSTIDSLARVDRSPHRWDVLRDPGGSLVTFWYRQSPSPIAPQVFGLISATFPEPSTTGEAVVMLGPDGQLQYFIAVPPILAPDSAASREPDWAVPFALAGLDTSRFVRTAPAYQRYVGLQRAAWIGTRAAAPRDTVRVEAGAVHGQVTLFARLDPVDVFRMSHPDPTSRRRTLGRAMLILLVVLTVVLGGLFFILLNRNRPHADRRGARRAAIGVFTLLLAANLIGSHSLFTLLIQLPTSLGGAVLVAGIVWVFYLALEPVVRQIWPRMLISWSRLVSGEKVRARDPLVGRALLVGLAAGALLSCQTFLKHFLQATLGGLPGRPELVEWNTLLGIGPAFSAVIQGLVASAFGLVVFIFVLVLFRLITRNQIAAITLTLVTFELLSLALPREALSLPVRLGLIALDTLFTLLSTYLLLRYGLLAALAATAVTALVTTVASPSFTEWYDQPLVLGTLVIAALAGWAYWVASAGRRLLPSAGSSAAR